MGCKLVEDRSKRGLITAAQESPRRSCKAFRDSKEQKILPKQGTLGFRTYDERTQSKNKKKKMRNYPLKAKHLAALSNNTNSEVEKLLARVKEMQEKEMPQALNSKLKVTQPKSPPRKRNAIEAQRKKNIITFEHNKSRKGLYKPFLDIPKTFLFFIKPIPLVH